VAPAKKVPWQHLSDEDLLGVRLCDLGVRIRGSELHPRVRQLYAELEERGLRIRPRCYLSDEWHSPGDQAAIGIPFYLAHPRLKALESRMMPEVEGGTAASCMRLLRHEAAHALDHAYGLHRRRDWKQVFGSPRARYNPHLYAADPGSRKHVRNLPDHYAQCHPEEDFAETFAVWLNPGSQWSRRYRGWPAMRKLRYVDRLMREIAARPVPGRRPELYADARTLRSTLGTYYRRKFRLYGVGELTFAVRDLRGIFRSGRAAQPGDRASNLIRRYKRLLVESISSWSGERPGRISPVVASLARMCDQHGLTLRHDPAVSLMRFSAYATTLVVNRLHTSSFRRKRRT
jgi:hypothetical protein